ncbi:PLP-dependent aminotransferase family protein [Streptomyces angustmyceticus]|uniref:GntR family transcriptional regulator n=2 Tax=Streptomyces angustmyceticus TaxID=285578 RepID=A0A5J4LH93_9ACTN|nr:PLP-dependent aminotransferase family protein [Streptomyces angustmyceticus]UAL67517.1 PLP-dependent aminotransferase family protein [Streptomyces angustmyceticus]GES31271.1 GntR family transcriptional regulator [Streptomyces angustmyceticus]
MEDSWATFGRDLHLDLTGPGGLRAALLRALREAVRSGRLAPGTRLPSSRSLAADLGLARNTVADAYAELVAEGWLSARQGSGTRVAWVHLPDGARGSATPRATPAARRAPAPADRADRPRFDLTPGTPDVSAFPRTAWLAAARRALTAAPSEAFGYGTSRGRPELRTVLADYLARARGVRADPERIVVCAGFMQGLALLSRALGPGRLAVESYGLDFHRAVITRAGLRTVPLPVDERGARTEELTALDEVRAALLTPAHQFPTGVPLHPDRRAAAVGWARATGGFILEDDYDGEFRYDRQPVGALQGLDPEHVVYLGTASKSLAPALRLAWMVLPDRLVDPVLALKSTGEWQSGALDQLTLAEFLSTGAYDRHLRGMRLRYRRRRDQLVAALADRAPQVRASGIAAGLHAVLELPPGTEQSVLHTARRHGLALEGLHRFHDPTAPPATRDALVVAYGTPPDHSFAGALDALLGALPPGE